VFLVMRYYGGKSKLVSFIYETASAEGMLPGATVFDGFCGTSSVGRYFKGKGHKVISNDFLNFPYRIASSYIGLNQRPRFRKLGCDPIDLLNEIPPVVGFFSTNYSPLGVANRQYFSSENAKKIDAIRKQINDWSVASLISSSEENYLICSLLEAANLTSNVSGTYAAFLKSWDSRALKPLTLRHLDIVDNKQRNIAICGDLLEVVGNYEVDVLYLDPPYNSRQYASNYFLLDVIAEGWFENTPDVRGLTGMRNNSSLKSDFCLKNKAAFALELLISRAQAELVLLSYNDEGIIPSSRIREILSEYGSVSVYETEHKRYMAINQDGSHTKTVESLYVLKRSS